VPVELTRVQVQRIGIAVEAARKGWQIKFRVEGDNDAAYLTWWTNVRHPISTGSERGMKELLPEVQKEFARQMAAVHAPAAQQV